MLQTPRQKDYLYPMNTFLNSTVAFTGHRKYHGEAHDALIRSITNLYGMGYRTFLSGMAVGFDLAAAESVLALKSIFSDIRLVAVVPFEGQQLRYGAADRRRFEAVMKQADERIVLSQYYHDGVYMVRNNYLVEHCSVLIACYDGSAGGTRYTVQKAGKRGREVINISPDAPREEVVELKLF